jgi:hypothetical protein
MRMVFLLAEDPMNVQRGGIKKTEVSSGVVNEPGVEGRHSRLDRHSSALCSAAWQPKQRRAARPLYLLAPHHNPSSSRCASITAVHDSPAELCKVIHETSQPGPDDTARTRQSGAP